MHKYVSIRQCVLCACVQVPPMLGSINEVDSPFPHPQALAMALVSPAWSPRHDLACFLPDTESDAGCDLGQQTPLPQLKTKLLPKRMRPARARDWPGFLFPKMEGVPASGLRHIHAHTPGGKRTIRSENSMQIS